MEKKDEIDSETRIQFYFVYCVGRYYFCGLRWRNERWDGDPANRRGKSPGESAGRQSAARLFL